MADPNQPQSGGRLDEARQAMEDSAHREARELAAATAEKRRHDAMIAMEGYEHKVKRELEDRAQREAALAKKIHEDQLAKQAAEAAKAAELRAAAETASAEERQRQEELQLQGFQQAQEAITKLREKETVDLESSRTIKTDVVRSVAEDKIEVSDLSRGAALRNPLLGWRAEPIAKNYLLITVSCLILAVLTLGLAFIYFVPRTSYEQRPEQTVVSTLVFADYHENINTYNLPAETVLQKFKILKNKSVYQKYADALYNLYLINLSPLVRDQALGEKPLGRAAFLTQTGLTLPLELSGNLTDDIMAGTYKLVPGSIFLVFKVRNYDGARAALLSNENATMASLFAPLLEQPIGRLLLEKKFQDRVMNNIDVRVLFDNGGEPAIIYGFIDARTLVFASGEKTFSKVLTAYQKGRTSGTINK